MGSCLVLGAMAGRMPAQEVAPENITIRTNISYLKGNVGDEYAKTQCLLDVYLPRNQDKPFPLIVWYHGGALKGGAKNSSVSVAVAKSLAARGVGVILAEYRLSPKVKFPVYVQDSAQAVRWAVENAASLKAQPKIYVGGHSAGGYLAAILAMDGRYLKEAGVEERQIAGYVSMSGQMMTHFTVAAERGISEKVITVDDAAPVHHLRTGIPPMLVLVGDNDWPARLEENAYFVSALKKVGGNTNISFLVIKGRDHGGILKNTAEPGDPAATAILEFMSTGKLPPDGSEPVKMPGKETLVDPATKP
ncbi:MAG: alpha/beta hydrolase [Candidatus Methylacidiphilales bacterium]